MAGTLMKLGSFTFEADGLSYESLKRTRAFRWSSQARLQRRPAQQFVGIGEESLNLSGTWYPTTSDALSALDTLNDLAMMGEPHTLVDGLGQVWGLWVIHSISETQTFFHSHGVPRKQQFQLQLKAYGEDQ